MSRTKNYENKKHFICKDVFSLKKNKTLNKGKFKNETKAKCLTHKASSSNTLILIPQTKKQKKEQKKNNAVSNEIKKNCF